MMTSTEYLEKIEREIREKSQYYYRQGASDYQQKALDYVKSQYPLELYYGSFSDVLIVLTSGKAYMKCYWLTGEWLFREDRGGDFDISTCGDVAPNNLQERKKRYTSKQFTSELVPTFQKVRDAEKRLRQRPAEFQRWYADITGEFVQALFAEKPDTKALREIMARMQEGVSPDMNEAQAAAVLLKAVVEEHRRRCQASPEDSDPIYLISDIKFLVSTEFAEHEERLAYFQDCYEQLLNAASLFFWEGASYAQWKSVVGQLFKVGSGRKVDNLEIEREIMLRLLCGYSIRKREEEVAMDLLHSLLQTLDEMRQGKHRENIEKVKARLAQEAEDKKTSRKA